MNQTMKALAVETSFVTDRGLNERRPLNEDSCLTDSERSLFAVADGVGGAEAGEVASQTAIEVLAEAFRHQLDGADIEDLMELAIQRANASIHQMAQDHARFSMMATTIVALHLKGQIATIGHVGDSRLYRLKPDGQLIRETEDHSVVEEEVRAGRMTPEQAATHPSKNVISRALGAENAVEVDMKTMEVEDGTEFLLCTDGITRHIPDYELRHLLIVQDDLAGACEELKRLCFERGAEDNLTAVLVRVGARIPANDRLEGLEPTISPEAEVARAANPENQPVIAGIVPEAGGLVAPSRIAFPSTSAETSIFGAPESAWKLHDQPAKGSFGRTVGRLFLFLVVLVALAGAFYGGTQYHGPIPFLGRSSQTIPQVSQSPVAVVDPVSKFESARREIDREPQQWLTNAMVTEMNKQGIQDPLQSTDAEFLYLYGRASLLSGNGENAVKAFEASINRADSTPGLANSTVRKDATLALAAASLKSDKDKPEALTHFDEMLQKPANSSSP